MKISMVGPVVGGFFPHIGMRMAKKESFHVVIDATSEHKIGWVI